MALVKVRELKCLLKSCGIGKWTVFEARVKQAIPIKVLLQKYFDTFKLPDELAVIVLIYIDRICYEMPDFVLSTHNIYK